MAILAAVGPRSAPADALAEFSTQQVRVSLAISANDFIYLVTNLGREPIVGVEFPEHVCYGFRAPEGWLLETSAGRFRTSTGDARKAIPPNGMGKFSFRVSGSGAVLGRGTVKVQLQSGHTVEVPDVLAPSSESSGHVALVACTIAILFLLHSGVVMWRNRRATPAATPGA